MADGMQNDLEAIPYGQRIAPGPRLEPMPRKRHVPTVKELEERVKLDLEPDEAIRLIMETGEGGQDEPAESIDD
jgi:hypothetical protein